MLTHKTCSQIEDSTLTEHMKLIKYFVILYLVTGDGRFKVASNVSCKGLKRKRLRSEKLILKLNAGFRFLPGGRREKEKQLEAFIRYSILYAGEFDMVDRLLRFSHPYSFIPKTTFEMTYAIATAKALVHSFDLELERKLVCYHARKSLFLELPSMIIAVYCQNAKNR